MNIFKLKFKLHHLVNVFFYLFIFIIGFIFGLGVCNTKAYVLGDSVPNNAIVNSLTNFYLDETEDEYNYHKYGYNNSISYSSFINRQQFLESHHVYDYLHQVTEYLIQNSSDYYDFFVFYYDFNENYSFGNPFETPLNRSNGFTSFASAIYIYYYPKSANLSSFDVFNKYSNKYFFGVSSSLPYNSNQCLAGSNCNGFIPGSGLDVIPVSYAVYDSNYGQYRNNWFLDSLYDHSNNFNIIDYFDFEPFYNSYRSNLLYLFDNTPDFISNDTWFQNAFHNSIISALGDELFIFLNFNKTFIRPLRQGNSGLSAANWMFYYSTLPLVYSRDDVLMSIGSKLIYTGDEIPTYSESKNISFETLSNEQKTINYLNENGYRMFCSDTQSVFISPGVDSPNDIELFFLENIFDIDREIYFNFYNYNLSDYSLNPIDTNSLPVYLSSNNLSNYNLPDYLDGYTYYNYSFSNNNKLVVSRTDFSIDETDYDSILDMLLHPFSNYHDSYMSTLSDYFYYNEKGAIFLDNDHANYSRYENSLDGNWCFYITDGVYVTSITTQNSDDNYKNPNDANDSCNKSDISFNGQVMTENGLIDITYVNPFCRTDDNVWKYSDSFMTHNKSTFIFLTDISHYFFNNVDNRFFEGFIAIILIILFIKMCSYFGGGN